ncbi:hypothetical protein PENSPDRAFT_66426 [Peniophora sp. CONT]|nr:hypothetical protein PENSPDRAFT_66426 [Peniophora sp. CONT]
MRMYEGGAGIAQRCTKDFNTVLMGTRVIRSSGSQSASARKRRRDSHRSAERTPLPHPRRLALQLTATEPASPIRASSLEARRIMMAVAVDSQGSALRGQLPFLVYLASNLHNPLPRMSWFIRKHFPRRCAAVGALQRMHKVMPIVSCRGPCVQCRGSCSAYVHRRELQRGTIGTEFKVCRNTSIWNTSRGSLRSRRER